MYCTVAQVITFTGVKPKNFRVETAELLSNILTEYITQAESLIDSYTHSSFTTDTPPAITNICLRLVSNMIAMYMSRRDSPIIQTNDYNIEFTSSNIFSQDLKNDLKPFVVDKSTVSDKIDFFTITGD